MYRAVVIAVMACVGSMAAEAAEPLVVNLWPGRPPGEAIDVPPEIIRDDPTDRPVGGRGTVRIANVSTPMLTIYRPAPERDTGAAAIICPGGGFISLAWAHEGTDVAEWLNTI